ncbi:mucin-2 protein [Nocardioides panacisoli]|uniref:ARB-07466-like C-terminal domain-containing protein n=1 Tax=Nocardioides panacisoli TaxID=627624 RepID=A0ABP7IXM2_9ACTN
MGGKHNAKRVLRSSRAPWVAGSLAVLATSAAVTAGVLGSGGPDALLTADSAAAAGSIDHADRTPTLSRDGDNIRPTAPQDTPVIQTPADIAMLPANVRTAVKRAHLELWTTTDLNLWTRPDKTAKQTGEIKSGKKVLVTGRSLEGRQEIVVDGESRWVTSGYLSKDKPLGSGAGLSDAPCPDSSVEQGLAADTILVYRSVCHAFPQVTEYGGWAARTEHNTGHALDVMVYGDKALGDAIAQWAFEHASELNLYDIIWYDRIWTPVRASEGWRDYGDHGSPTANHMDHVHIGTN